MSNYTVIKTALQDLGVTGLGREPNTGMTTAALDKLEALVKELSSPPMSPPWIQQDVTTDSTAEEGDSIRVNSTVPVTISIPVSTSPREREVDCCGCITVRETCTGSRAPLDKARIRIADVYGTIQPLLYIYRADLAAWIKASDMTLEQDCPYADEAGLSAMLAVRLSASTGQPVPPSVALSASRGLWNATYSADVAPGAFY